MTQPINTESKEKGMIDEMNQIINDLKEKRAEIDKEIKKWEVAVKSLMGNSLPLGRPTKTDEERKAELAQLIQELKNIEYDPSWSVRKKILYLFINKNRKLYVHQIIKMLLEIDEPLKEQYESITNLDKKNEYFAKLRSALSWNCSILFEKGVITQEKKGSRAEYTLSTSVEKA